MTIPRLEKLGLSEKEAKVYVAALEIGAATADQLAKHTKLNRSTTYVQLQELLQSGLMSTFKKGKKTYFAPESPHNLTRIVERKHRELDEQEHLLESFVPELLKSYKISGVRPVVRSFEGKQGLITMRNEVLKMTNKELHVALAYEHMSSVFTSQELENFTEKRAKLGIKAYILYSKEGEDFAAPKQLQQLRRIDSDKFPFEADVYIYDERVAIASYKGEITGVIIESKAVSQTFRSLFEIAWASVQR